MGATGDRGGTPLLIVHTGTMKGKSTAAFGTALRAWAAGLPVGVFQFVKTGRWRTGEEAAFQALARAHRDTGEGAPVDWHSLGDGWSWTREPGDEVGDAAHAREGWERIRADLAAERYGLYLLDEFTYPMSWGWIDVDEVVAAFRDRPGFQHVIVTGRGADPRLVEAADLVVDMSKVKHPLDVGVRAQRGIDW